MRSPGLAGRAPSTELDPFATVYVADPYPVYDEIRQAGPIVWCRARDCWLILGYEHVRWALRETATFSSHEGIGEKRYPAPHRPSLLALDPPAHGPLRATVARAFAASTLRDLEGAIERRFDVLLRRVASEPAFDLVEQIAAPLPIQVIGSLLGLTEDEEQALYPLAFELATTVDLVEVAASRRLSSAVTFQILDEVFSAAIARSHGDGAPRAMRSLRRSIAAGAITHDDAMNLCALLFSAGTHTTTSLIGSAALLLLPGGHLPAVSNDAAHCKAVVEECLRLEAPLQAVFRTAACSIDLAGAEIRAGDRVALVLAAANRSPERFENPHSFSAERAPNPHLSFAHGAHHCLGAALARMETQIVLAGLARAVPQLTLQSPPPCASRGPLRILRGPDHVIVENHAAVTSREGPSTAADPTAAASGPR